LPGSKPFLANQSPLTPHQPKDPYIKASRTADHIAAEFENVSAICDENGRVRRVGGGSFILKVVMRECAELMISVYMKFWNHITALLFTIYNLLRFRLWRELDIFEYTYIVLNTEIEYNTIVLYRIQNKKHHAVCNKI
jgi:hypothetical protein